MKLLSRKIPLPNLEKDAHQIFLSLMQNKKHGPLFFLKESNSTTTIAWDFLTRGDLHWAKMQSGPIIGGKSFWSQWSEEKKSVWHDFSPEFFFSPKFLFRITNSGTFLYLQGKTETEIDKLFLDWETLLKKNAPQPLPAITVELKKEFPNKAEWTTLCEKAAKTINENHLLKIVLARTKTGSFHDDHEQVCSSVLNHLLEETSPNSHKFIFRENRDVFCGISPEYLFSMEKRKLSIPAIAGTRPRGEGASQDKLLGEELLLSAKERSEHAMVVDFIQEKIKELGVERSPAREPELLKLQKLQHLFTPNEVELKDNQNPLAFLKLLHPTPAMGGLPVAGASTFLQKEEGWERGYFASPMGYYLPEEHSAAFVVGIRSMLIGQGFFQSYAGAGFVKNSIPEQEWQETEEKMQTALELFGREPL